MIGAAGDAKVFGKSHPGDHGCLPCTDHVSGKKEEGRGKREENNIQLTPEASHPAARLLFGLLSQYDLLFLLVVARRIPCRVESKKRSQINVDPTKHRRIPGALTRGENETTVGEKDITLAGPVFAENHATHAWLLRPLLRSAPHAVVPLPAQTSHPPPVAKIAQHIDHPDADVPNYHAFSGETPIIGRWQWWNVVPAGIALSGELIVGNSLYRVISNLC